MNYFSRPSPFAETIFVINCIVWSVIELFFTNKQQKSLVAVHEAKLSSPNLYIHYQFNM